MGLCSCAVICFVQPPGWVDQTAPDRSPREPKSKRPQSQNVGRDSGQPFRLDRLRLTAAGRLSPIAASRLRERPLFRWNCAICNQKSAFAPSPSARLSKTIVFSRQSCAQSARKVVFPGRFSYSRCQSPTGQPRQRWKVAPNARAPIVGVKNLLQNTTGSRPNTKNATIAIR